MIINNFSYCTFQNGMLTDSQENTKYSEPQQDIQEMVITGPKAFYETFIYYNQYIIIKPNYRQVTQTILYWILKHTVELTETGETVS